MFVFGVLVNLLIFEFTFGVPAVLNQGDGYRLPDDTFEKLEFQGEKIYGKSKSSSAKGGDSFHRMWLADKPSFWPNKTVPYEINPALTQTSKEKIMIAINEFHKYTCLKFREKRSSDRDYIYFDNGAGCYTTAGRTGGKQVIYLAEPSCMVPVYIMHEIMHTIGFLHEHSRLDRDEYITVNYENINPKYWPSFDKIQPNMLVDDGGVGYDYDSVMHYEGDLLAMYGKPSMEAKVKGIVLGSKNDTFSKKDIQKMRIMYQCGDANSSGGSETSFNRGGKSIIYKSLSFFFSLCSIFLR